MPITPGTERAIVKISELLPKLLKHLEEVSYQRPPLTQRLPVTPKKASEVSVTIPMTPSEWCEAVNAISIRATQVDRNDRCGDDMTDEQRSAWAQELQSAYKKITVELDKRHIVY